VPAVQVEVRRSRINRETAHEPIIVTQALVPTLPSSAVLHSRPEPPEFTRRAFQLPMGNREELIFVVWGFWLSSCTRTLVLGRAFAVAFGRPGCLEFS
jgi:hypothetical protein